METAARRVEETDVAIIAGATPILGLFSEQAIELELVVDTVRSRQSESTESLELEMRARLAALRLASLLGRI